MEKMGRSSGRLRKKSNEPRTSRTVGLREIAKAAGLAVSTVSRALSNPDRVSRPTRDRVLAVASRMNYTANAAARSLRVGVARMFLVLLPRWHGGESVPPVLSGIDAALFKHGYGVVLGHIDRIETTERHLFEQVCGGMVDGVLAIAPHLPGNSFASLQEVGVPIVSVLMDRSELGVPSVVTNDRIATRNLVAHLLRAGHSRLMYLTGPEGNYHEIERFAGLQDALGEAGLPLSAVRRQPGNFDFESGAAAARHYISSSLRKRPTAVICCNDNMAVSFMKHVSAAGLRVPDDLVVAGFDGLDLSEYCAPPLTTVKQPFKAMGAAGAALLLDICAGTAGDVPMRTVIDSTLVLRESTGTVDADR